jgi:hypothetical protein
MIFMNKTEIMANLTRTFNRTGLKLKKHSPEILLAAGVVGVVASGVMACKATLKVEEIIDDAKHKIDTIHEVSADPTMAEKYSEEDSKKDLAIVYTQTAVKLIKLYGPSVALAGVSLGCMIGSNRILNKRNVALAAAYTAVDKGFKEYRGRVIERFGKELDKELKYGIKAKEIEEVSVDEKGKEVSTKSTVEVMDPNNYSPYSIIFDDGNAGWDPDPELTKYFLIQQQNWANDRLKAKGHLFLNEVYDMLGAKRTKAGAQVGWVYDEKNPVGDNYVDFGIFDIYNPKSRDFVNGYEKVIVLDFNVDGVILDLI